MDSSIRLAPLKPEHYESVKAIYTQGIATHNATFTPAALSWADWNNTHLSHSRIVALLNNKVVGWAALSKVSEGPAYYGVTENSVYVDENYRGMGIGLLLLQELIKESEANNIWSIEARIFPENITSIELHKKCGFRIMGEYIRRGKMDGKWRNVVLMERRSNIVGID